MTTQKINVSIIMVSKSKTIIFMALTVGIAATNILEDTICLLSITSFVIKEFQINQPMIQNEYRMFEPAYSGVSLP